MAGGLPEKFLNHYTALVTAVPGAFAEIGVAEGVTFCKLIRAARIQGRECHAFDSFEGLPKPSPIDEPFHFEGKYLCSTNRFIVNMAMEGYACDRDYEIHKGWVPDCFNGFDKQFAFVFVDLDHYDATESALKWAWKRLEAGGIIALDDYFGPKYKRASSKAITEFTDSLRDTRQPFRIMSQANDPHLPGRLILWKIER